MRIQVGHHTIGRGCKPFIVAEMSGNHNRSLERALAIVDAAAEAGAHAIKLQTYTADTMTLKGAYRIEDPDSLWYGRELYELYQEAYTPWDWHRAIFERAASRGMIAFSSPFDESAVDFLETLRVPLYKIASFENTDIPLLKKVAETGKPVIMSTGVSDLSVIDEGVRTLQQYGCTQLIILKCTSTYPATPENSNIATIAHMRQLYPDVLVGLSDHTMGIGVPVAAVAFGACLIEKHFTLRRSDGGVDSAFSLEPEELRALVIESERAWQGIGRVQYGVQQAEEKSLFFKRSIWVTEDIRQGEEFTARNLRVLRPGTGLAPKHYFGLLGRRAGRDYRRGEPFVE